MFLRRRLVLGGARPQLPSPYLTPALKSGWCPPNTFGPGMLPLHEERPSNKVPPRFCTPGGSVGHGSHRHQLPGSSPGYWACEAQGLVWGLRSQHSRARPVF